MVPPFDVLPVLARKTFTAILRSLEDPAAAPLTFEARRDMGFAQFPEEAEKAIKDAQGDSRGDIIQLWFEFGSDSGRHRLLLRDEKEFELVRELDDEDGFVVYFGHDKVDTSDTTGTIGKAEEKNVA